ncbi:toprim domain-containing protein [Nonomuraea jabiensis]|uniref:toprim domain-containing protein n=1 Tax=Nonomuraea jabiensis TaxID=882448 RepID=UPI00342A43EF
MAGQPRKVASGWDSFGNIVPGDVPAAMEALGLFVLSVDESGEAKSKCPAHFELLGREDRHPSFSVNIDSGLFGCWSCGFKGIFANLVQYCLKQKLKREIPHDEAIAWIRARGTIQRVERILAKRPVETDTTKLVNEASLALCVPPPEWALEDRGISAEACARYGVLWEPDRELWITPIRDHTGRLHGWQEKNKRYFANHPETIKKSRFVFGYQTLPEKSERVVVVESPLDALIVWQDTGEPCVSTYGASVSDHQMLLLMERTNNVVLFMDHDAPGRKARDRLIDRWRGTGLALSTVDYRLLEDRFRKVVRDGLDPGELWSDENAYLLEHTIPASIAAITLGR